MSRDAHRTRVWPQHTMWHLQQGPGPGDGRGGFGNERRGREGRPPRSVGRSPYPETLPVCHRLSADTVRTASVCVRAGPSGGSRRPAYPPDHGVPAAGRGPSRAWTASGREPGKCSQFTSSSAEPGPRQALETPRAGRREARPPGWERVEAVTGASGRCAPVITSLQRRGPRGTERGLPEGTGPVDGAGVQAAWPRTRDLTPRW